MANCRRRSHVVNAPAGAAQAHQDARQGDVERRTSAGCCARSRLLLGYDATRDLPLDRRGASRRRSRRRTRRCIDGKKLVIVPILRAGLGLAEGLLDLDARSPAWAMSASIATRARLQGRRRVLLQDARRDISDRLTCIVCDPMLATANSAIAAVDLLKGAGARWIKMLCVLAAPEGVKAFVEAHPDVPLTVAAIDRELNDHAYIMPGLGDAGDRLFGTK